MLNIAQLLQRVTACGFAVEITDAGPQLVPIRSEHVMPKPLLKALRDNRDAVVKFLSECAVCGKDTRNAEDRERLADPLYCDRGGSREVRDGSGTTHPATQRCPFKG